MATLTEFLVSKAMKKREDAKNADASQSQTPNPTDSTSKPADNDSSSGEKKKGMFGGAFSSLSNLFSAKKPQPVDTNTNDTKPKQPRTSGGTTGLAKILSQGFGSLTADTLGLSGSLSNITSILNQSLQANSSTATSVTTLTSILSDQLENQTALLGAANVVKPTGRQGKFAGSGGKLTPATGQTLTEWALENWKQIQGAINFISGLFSGGGLMSLVSRFLPAPVTQALSQGAGAVARVAGPVAAVAGTGLAASYAGEASRSWGEQFKAMKKEDKKGLLQKASPLLGMMPGLQMLALKAGFNKLDDNDLKLIDEVVPRYLNLQSALGETIGAPFRALLELALAGGDVSKSNAKMAEIDANLRENFRQVIDPNGKKGSWGSAWGDEYGSAESRISNSSGGFVGMLPSLSSGGVMPSLAAGGANVMIGEAAGGNQGEVVQDLRSSDGKKMMGGSGGADPGMKTSGAATLTVIDQLIQSMGDKGPAVAQALGPDISNLAKEFGMSQTLPNIRIGGGKFKQDGNTKKQRDAYLQKLIAGSLSGLNAKKEGEGQVGPARVGTGGPGTEGTPEQRDQIRSRQEELFASLPGGYSTRAVTNKDKTSETLFESKENIAGGKFYKRKDSEGNYVDVMGPGPKFRPIEGTNGERWYDQDGNLYSWKPGTKIKELRKDEMAAGWDDKPFIRKPDTGHVRVNGEAWSLASLFEDKEHYNKPYQDPPAEGEYSYRFGKKWAKGTTGEMKGKVGWLTPSDTYGGRAPSLPNPGDIKFESGGQVQVSSLDWSKFVNALAPYSDVMSGKFDVSSKMTPPSSYNVKNYVTTSSPSATATDQTESGISTATIINMIGGESSGAAPIISTPPDQTINPVRSAFPEYSSVATLCTTRHIIFA